MGQVVCKEEEDGNNTNHNEIWSEVTPCRRQLKPTRALWKPLSGGWRRRVDVPEGEGGDNGVSSMLGQQRWQQ